MSEHSWMFEPVTPPRREDQDPPGYIDLDREGVKEAINRGVIRAAGSTNGAVCLRCGALVAGIELHDAYHAREEANVEWLGRSPTR